MKKRASNPGLHDSDGSPPLPRHIAPILDAMVKHGVGKPVSLAELRGLLPVEFVESRDDLQRRIRQLREHGYAVPYSRAKGAYTLEADKPVHARADTSAIPSRLAAQIRLAAHGGCQMCGKTITEDRIKLDVDHRVPRHWGGSSTDPDNLWAICKPCNIAKQAFFATLPVSVMSKCMTPKEPIIRIGELLKAFEGRVCPRSLLEVVGRDDEWPRRLRELRDLGWIIEHVYDADGKGRYRHAYKLTSWKPWPTDVRTAVAAAAAKRNAKSFG